ncbi:alternate-type signal peptide domain-containing protein [Lysobacter korlensis]|uniref:Alternate-type signal peptide domain-containing protein n=1 Tax=Lysobacter korlensis TaxID=553636 RepID=A0ABV6S2G2_9GAMM
MNKLVKGSIAGAAGIALLLGGAGTFALWNSTVALPAHTITAGNLSLVNDLNGVWTKDGVAINPTSYRIVPGTTLEYNQTLTVNAVGDGLKANLTYSGLTATGNLDALITKTLAVSSASTNATVNGSTIAFTPGTAKVNVKITVSFPASATTGQNETLNLNAVTFTLTQTV